MPSFYGIKLVRSHYINNCKNLMKIKYNSLLVFFCFLLYPLGALPLLFIEIYNNKKYAFVLLSLFMGLVAYLIAPTGDLYVHSIEFSDFKDFTFSDFLSILPFTIDFVYYFIAFIFAKLAIPFGFIRFIFVVLSYLIVFDIFRDVCSSNNNLNKNKKLTTIVFFICFFQVLFMSVAIGLRFGFSVYLMLYGVYLLFKKNNFKGWFFILLSCFTHFSMILIFFSILIAKLFKITKLNKTVLFLSLGFAIIGTDILQFIIDLLPLNDFLKEKLIMYITGYWGNSFLEDHSFLYRISRLFNHISVYPLMFFLFITKVKNQLLSIVFVLSILLFILYPITNLFYRFVMIIVPILLISFLLSYDNSKLHSLFLILIFTCSSITFFLGNIYSHKRNLQISYEYKLTYTSFPMIFFSSYDKNWIDDHITSNGDIVGNE